MSLHRVALWFGAGVVVVVVVWQITQIRCIVSFNLLLKDCDIFDDG